MHERFSAKTLQGKIYETIEVLQASLAILPRQSEGILRETDSKATHYLLHSTTLNR